LAFTVVSYVNEAGALLLSFALLLVCFGAITGLGAAFWAAGLGKVAGIVVSLFSDAFLLVRDLTVAGFRFFVSCIRAMFIGSFKFLSALVSIPIGLFDGFRNYSESRRETQQARRDARESKKSNERNAVDDGFVLGEVLEDDTEPALVSAEPVISRRDTLLRRRDKRRKLKKEQKKSARKSKKAEEAAVKAKEEETQPKDSDYADFQLPALDLLVGAEGSSSLAPDDKELISNSKRLETALANFKIGGRVVEVHPGPVVTLYQFEPGIGVKVQRVINLADDLALALKVASVRVFAPVPGQGTVGIEVPNSKREVVRLRDVLDSEEYQQASESLLLALGKDTYGDAFVADLETMPHLLIAGATGTGKSVCINSILLSLLYRNSPGALRFLLIDPKMLELSVYENIPHLKAPVVTNPKRARGVLWWAVEEMERRYELMRQMGVRDLATYNRELRSGRAKPSLFGQEKAKNTVVELEEKDVVTTGNTLEGFLDRKINHLAAGDRVVVPDDATVLPRIVIVVDELADLMLTVGREVEELLTRLAQKARAAGIHLIVATQRPSVNVITGLIKANFPARISFKVASKIDARTVMDTSGAERLLGQGDMLFLSPRLGRVNRLHSPFVSDKEVHDVVSWLRAQGEPEYDAAIEKMVARVEESEKSGVLSNSSEDEYDEFYDRAVQLVIDKGHASTSMVQRAYRIGYNRAARILETMERDGVVGPADGARPREVLVGSIE